ncbi:hypothetical protein LCL97_07095 [Seohaeicola saemankumensis]|nr:hypothetical protein [Seohaeicola saemankumensis]MCA0870582.1 hypothetical protein [Seohaeicola saemankumensis]
MDEADTDRTPARAAKRTAARMALGWYAMWAVAYPVLVLVPKGDPPDWLVMATLAVRVTGLGLALGALLMDMRAERQGIAATLWVRAPLVIALLFSVHYLDDVVNALTGATL